MPPFYPTSFLLLLLLPLLLLLLLPLLFPLLSLLLPLLLHPELGTSGQNVGVRHGRERITRM